MHTWAIESDDEVDRDVLKKAIESSGAVIMGRRLFDIIDGPGGWNDEMGYGAGLAATPPFFVVTHHAPEEIRLALDRVVGRAVEMRASVGRMVVPSAARKDTSLT